MKKRKTFLYSGIFLAGGGLLISLLVMVGLMTGFVKLMLVSPVLWRLPFGLMIVSGLFVVASVVMLVLGLTIKAEKQD